MINRMITRKPQLNIENLHPKLVERMNVMTQAPLPLTYKLQKIPKGHDIYNDPIGNNKHLPFFVARTHLSNLPVFTEYRNNGMRKLTIIKKLRGDVDVRFQPSNFIGVQD